MSPEEFQRLMETPNPDPLTLALILQQRLFELEQRVAALEMQASGEDAVTYGTTFALPE